MPSSLAYALWSPESHSGQAGARKRKSNCDLRFKILSRATVWNSVTIILQIYNLNSGNFNFQKFKQTKHNGVKLIP